MTEWEKEWDDALYQESFECHDGGGVDWVQLESDIGGILGIFEEFLGMSWKTNTTKVRIKARKGAVMFEVI